VPPIVLRGRLVHTSDFDDESDEKAGRKTKENLEKSEEDEDLEEDEEFNTDVQTHRPPLGAGGY